VNRVVKPPIVASWLSGFVIGVVLTLLATGTALHSGDNSTAPSTLAPPTPYPDQQLFDRVKRIAIRQLGPGYPDSKVQRFISLTLAPATSEFVGGPPFPPRLSRFRSVAIAFRLNDNPLGPTWRFKTAQADIFAVMKALYTSQLPVYSTEMDGYYPVKSGKKVKVQRVLIALMAHSRAETIPWKRWGRENEGRLWSILTFKYVSPKFA
jgi:hypothetical protein